jgi:hypothetical protein
MRLIVARLGVPLDSSGDASVLGRARQLAKKRPEFYQMDPNGEILWCMTVDIIVFQRIYDWVLFNRGSEPD